MLLEMFDNKTVTYLMIDNIEIYFTEDKVTLKIKR